MILLSLLIRLEKSILLSVNRKIFINNILSRVTANENIARQTAQRLMYGDSRPFFALVGVSLAAGGGGMLTQESEYENMCWEIRVSFGRTVLPCFCHH